MEYVEISGDFILISSHSIRIDSILSIRPQNLVAFDPYTNKVLSKDHPKIIILLSGERIELTYGSREQQEESLKEINEKIRSYQLQKKSPGPGAHSVTFNVSDSQNINIVSQSTNTKIEQGAVSKGLEIIKEIESKVQNLQEMPEDTKVEVVECLTEIKEKIQNELRPSKFSIRALIGLTSDFASISSTAIQLAQLFGFIPQ